jgi:hypothetical protein
MIRQIAKSDTSKELVEDKSLIFRDSLLSALKRVLYTREWRKRERPLIFRSLTRSNTALYLTHLSFTYTVNISSVSD